MRTDTRGSCRRNRRHDLVLVPLADGLGVWWGRGWVCAWGGRFLACPFWRSFRGALGPDVVLVPLAETGDSASGGAAVGVEAGVVVIDCGAERSVGAMSFPSRWLGRAAARAGAGGGGSSYGSKDGVGRLRSGVRTAGRAHPSPKLMGASVTRESASSLLLGVRKSGGCAVLRRSSYL
jgi:hypothetical protein